MSNLDTLAADILKTQTEKTTKKEDPPPSVGAYVQDNDDDDDEKDDNNHFIKIEKWLNRNYDFRLNEVSVILECKEKRSKIWGELNENDLFTKMYRIGFKSFEKKVEILLKSNYVRKLYNPIRDYFETLPEYDPADGDLIKKFASFVKIGNGKQADFETHFKKALVRSIACGLKMLPFNKECIILKGKQGDGKTSLIRALSPFGADYYVDSFDPENPESEKHLCTCFMINIDELGDLSNKDIRKIKAKMSLTHVRKRLPYDKRDSLLPRIASFWATTNEEQFFTDVTGNVRWIVFEVDDIQHDGGGQNGYMSVDIKKMWAQAYNLLKTGFDYKLTDTERKTSEENNRNFQQISSEMEYLSRYFEKPKEGEPYEKLFKSEIIEYIEGQHRNLKLDGYRLSKALKFYGYEMASKYVASEKMSLKGYMVKYIPIEGKKAETNIDELKKNYVHNKTDIEPNIDKIDIKIRDITNLINKLTEESLKMRLENSPKLAGVLAEIKKLKQLLKINEDLKEGVMPF